MAVIEWYDHHGSPRTDERFLSKTQILENLEADCIIKTHGVILFEDDRRVIIASEERHDSDMVQPEYRYYMNIYKALIIQVTEET